MDNCYKLIDHYSTTSTGSGNCRAVRRGDESDDFAYDALMLGCMVKGLTNIDLLPGRVTSRSIAKSVDALRIEVGGITVATIPDHDNCSCLVDLTDGLTLLSSKTEPSGVLEMHRKQMEEQKVNHRYAECSCLQRAFTNLSAAPRLSGFRNVLEDHKNQ